MRVLRDMIVVSVTGRPAAQDLQSMMFNLNEDLLWTRTRQGPRGSPETDSFEGRGSAPDSHVYMPCKKIVVKVFGKYPGSVQICSL